jgi:hypothetical protein
MLDIRELWRVSLLCGGLWVGDAAFGVMLAVSVKYVSCLLVAYILGLLRLGRGLFSRLSR